MPKLQIQFLGHFHLTYDDRPITTLQQARLQSLLAYLILHRGALQSRRNLAFLLWPDSSEAQAHTNLRRELHHLRRALPNANTFLHRDTRSICWRPDAPFVLDVAAFEAEAAQVEQAARVGDAAALRAALEKSVALYTGDLLPGCYDDWIVSERERLSQMFVGLLEGLIRLLEGQGHYSGAIGHAQRLLRYDPLHEVAYRRLMHLHGLNGDRAQALRLYHTCVTTLRRELEVDPSPATRATYERLLDMASSSANQSAPLPTAATAALTTAVTEARLVGRQHEWERVQAAWRTAAHGQAHFVLVTGDAGLGKTRLAEELLTWAGRQGVSTARSRCYAAEGQLAYAPVADWLRTDAFQTGLSAVDDVWLVEVARLLPELLVERPHLARPPHLADSGQRLRLFEALARVVLAAHQPLLLALDDLQWCDRETLEWLHYLLRYAPQARLLIVGAARPEEVGADHPLHSLTLGLHSTDQATEVELGPLTLAATAALAAQVANRDLDPELAAHLYAETEGNPLFVIETARADSWPNPARAVTSALPPLRSGTALPLKIQTVIQARLARLSPPARELAELAAAIGRSFTFTELARARLESGRGDEDILVRGLDELWQRRIIREQGADAYDFSHDKIREVAYAEVSRARQRLLHRRVAQALESVHASDLDAVSGRIAAHYERVGLHEPAMRYYERAAGVARRVHANTEAKSLYSRAIAASRRIAPGADAAQLLSLYEGRALVCRSLTQYEEAIADLHQMRQLAGSAGNWQKEGESLCHLAYTHWLTFAEDQVPLIERYAREATALCAQTGDQRILARSLTLLGALDQVHRNLLEAGQKLEQALELCRRTEDKATLSETLTFLCLQAYLQGDSRSTLQFAQEGVAVAREIQDGLNELRTLAFLCQGHWSAGNFVQAFTHVNEGMAQAEARANTFIRGRLLNTLGWFHHELGDFSRAIAYNEASVELGRASGIHNVEISALVNLGYDYLALDQPARALTYFEPTLERVRQEGVGAHKWRWQMKLFMGLAEHAYSVGAHAPALRYVEEGLEEALATSSQKYIAKGWALRGRILHRLGNSEAAGVELERAFALAERLHSPSLSYPLAYALGQWYEAMGKNQEAAARYRQAQATVEQIAVALEAVAPAAGFLQSRLARAIAESVARTL